MNKQQKGFSIVELMVGVVLVGLIATVGWLVWDRQANRTSDSSTATSDTTKASGTSDSNGTEAAKLPEGFVAYENKDLAISFSYPSEWGATSLEQGYEMKSGHLVSGSEYLLTFADNKSVTAGFTSPDWKHDDKMGHGQKGAITAVSYSRTTATDYSGDNAKVVYEGRKSFVAGTVIAGMGCDGAGHVLVSNYSAAYSVAVLYYDQSGSGQFDDQTCDNYEKYLNPSTAETLKKIDATIKSL